MVTALMVLYCILKIAQYQQFDILIGVLVMTSWIPEKLGGRVSTHNPDSGLINYDDLRIRLRGCADCHCQYY